MARPVCKRKAVAFSSPSGPQIGTDLKDSWLSSGYDRVVDGAFAAIERHARTPIYSALLCDVLRNGLGETGIDGAAGRCWLATRLPLLICAALADDLPPEIFSVASAITIIDAGIYALDQIMDREIDGLLALHPSGATLLGAIALVGVVPNQILATLADRAMALDLVHMLADGLTQIGTGQLREIMPVPRDESRSATAATAVLLKSGERRALYAALAARCAGAGPERIAGCAAFGQALGVARQLHSDLTDLFGPGPSRDLASQILTLPLALYLDRADAEAEREMRMLLADQQNPERVKAAVCTRLKQAGVLREVVGMIERRCAQARAALDRMAIAGPAGPMLRDLIRTASVVA